MDKYLNVARAAKLAGVSRSEIQEEIRAGNLTTFEGSVSLDALQTLYPAVTAEVDEEVERAELLKDQAIGKFHPDHVTDTVMLATEVAKLRVHLAEAQLEVGHYRSLVEQLHQRLVAMQEQCTHREKLVLQAVISWMVTRLERRS